MIHVHASTFRRRKEGGGGGGERKGREGKRNIMEAKRADNMHTIYICGSPG